MDQKRRPIFTAYCAVRSWSFRVVPAPRIVLAGLIGYAVLGYVLSSLELAPEWGVRRVELAWLIGGLLFYGVGRVVSKHPILNPRYLEWLKTMPWAPRKPLPIGSVSLQLQDLTFLVIVFGVGRITGSVTPEEIGLIFLVPYLLALAVALAYSGRVGFAIAIVGGLAPVFLFWGGLGLSTVVSVYLLGWFGLHRSLAEFPWDSESARLRPFVPHFKEQTHRLDVVGWPLAWLSPSYQFPRVPRWEGVAIAAVVGLWVFTVVELGGPSFGIAAFIGIFGGMTRVVIYTARTKSPFSVFGRIVTGRLIVPRYDIAFVSPILAAAIGIGPVFARASSFRLQDLSALEGPLSFLVMLILLHGGPSLESFRLTGACRAMTGWAQNVAGQQVRQFGTVLELPDRDRREIRG